MNPRQHRRLYPGTGDGVGIGMGQGHVPRSCHLLQLGHGEAVHAPQLLLGELGHLWLLLLWGHPWGGTWLLPGPDGTQPLSPTPEPLLSPTSLPPQGLSPHLHGHLRDCPHPRPPSCHSSQHHIPNHPSDVPKWMSPTATPQPCPPPWRRHPSCVTAACLSPPRRPARPRSCRPRCPCARPRNLSSWGR